MPKFMKNKLKLFLLILFTCVIMPILWNNLQAAGMCLCGCRRLDGCWCPKVCQCPGDGCACVYYCNQNPPCGLIYNWCPPDCCGDVDNAGNCNWCPIGGNVPQSCRKVLCSDPNDGCKIPRCGVGPGQPGPCNSWCNNGGTKEDCGGTDPHAHGCCGGCGGTHVFAFGCTQGSCNTTPQGHCKKCAPCPCESIIYCWCTEEHCNKCAGEDCEWCSFHGNGCGTRYSCPHER